MHAVEGKIDPMEPVIKQGPIYTMATIQLAGGGTRELADNEVAIVMALPEERIAIMPWCGYVHTEALLAAHAIANLREAITRVYQALPRPNAATSLRTAQRHAFHWLRRELAPR